MTNNAIVNGYGDIYIQLKQKITKKAFIKKNIKSILMENSDILFLDIYGIMDALLISGNRHIPIYVLSYLQMQSQAFSTINNTFAGSNNFYCGQVLYKKYNSFEKKKIVIITGENKKIKSLLFDSMPVLFSGSYNFGWDDWNEKAVIIPIEKIENYFEVPTIEFIHVYVNNKKKVKEVMDWIKNKLNKEINYIDFGINVLPEYNKFLILLDIITHSIFFLIFAFSYFLLLILINIYMYQNSNEFYFLIISGIKKNYLYISLLLFFFLLVLFSLLVGFLLGYGIIIAINYFHCIVISSELNSYFFGIINWSIIYYYAIAYIFLLLLSVKYYFKKYLKNI